ncbi:MAG TPA: hypothetical protein VL092_01295 [Chitinophagaceae bacterium]|nr:hypothetical protein [Chitinophagaceae bacterium]
MGFELALAPPSIIRFFSPVRYPSIAIGVGNKPDPVPAVRGIDSSSRKSIHLNFVSFSFQVRLHLFENHPLIPTNNSGNIFAYDPLCPDFPELL